MNDREIPRGWDEAPGRKKFVLMIVREVVAEDLTEAGQLAGDWLESEFAVEDRSGFSAWALDEDEWRGIRENLAGY